MAPMVHIAVRGVPHDSEDLHDTVRFRRHIVPFCPSAKTVIGKRPDAERCFRLAYSTSHTSDTEPYCRVHSPSDPKLGHRGL